MIGQYKLFLLFVGIIFFLYFTSCEQNRGANQTPNGPNVILVSQEQKSEKSDYSEMMDMYSYNIWVEGYVKNIGDSPAKDISITFKRQIADGEDWLFANIYYLDAGERIEFKTSKHSTIFEYPSFKLFNIAFN